MEKLEEQFITSCQSLLTQEGKEICKEVLVMIGEKDEMMMKKALAFCDFFLVYDLDGVNTEKLCKRCKKYIEEYHNYQKYKIKFREANYYRKEI